MDTNMESKVRNTVLDYVNRGFMFTAFDITKTLRKDGDRVRHGEVNQLVQTMFSDNELGMYTRDLVNVGAPVEPFVYYHPYSDVTNYRSDWIDSNPSQNGMRNADGSDTDDGSATLTATPASASAPVAPVASTSATPVASTSSSSGSVRSTQRVRIPTGENRLQIPVTLVRQITTTVGAKFIALKGIDFASGPQKRVIVLKTASPTDSANYSVNKDGRIRLSSTDVSYLNGSRQFDIGIRNSNEIVVVPA